jgi:hypothetical protein
MHKNSPLSRLVVDELAIAEDEIAAALERYVRLTGDGQVVFEEAFTRLKARDQVLCVLLAVRAAQLLGLRTESALTPQEIVAVTGMAGGTVRPKLSALVRERLVAKGNAGYEIPVHALARATAEIGKS